MNASASTLAAAIGDRTRPFLVGYLPVGDPAVPTEMMSIMLECGVDVIEAGIAVERPVLDGPEVRESMARSLATGRSDEVHLADQLCAAGWPAAVWMSYRAVPDEAYLARVVASGVGGVLLPDADQLRLSQLANAADLSAIMFVEHAAPEGQLSAAAGATSYVMCATAGLTGVREQVPLANAAQCENLRARGVKAPIALGFGIGSGESARAAIDLGADGVVVGSALIRAARQGVSALTGLVTELRRALDG